MSSNDNSEERTILLIGATGNQGRAFIKAVSSSASKFNILALTRNASNSAAKGLASEFNNVQIAEGNLDDPDSIRRIFEESKQDKSGKGRIWGMFIVLPFPGLGVDASVELAQGTMLANLAVEFDIQHLIYSSSTLVRNRKDSDDLFKHQAGKARIERHIRSLSGLRWTPTFFMENFDGLIGGVTAVALNAGLKGNTKLELVAVDDIGRVACIVFEAPHEHISETILLTGDTLTTTELKEAYLRGAGRPLSYFPGFPGKVVVTWNKHSAELMAEFERVHVEQDLGSTDYAQPSNCRLIHPEMLTFEEWARTRKRTHDRNKNINKISILNLILGRS